MALAHDTTTRFPAGADTVTDTTTGDRGFSHAGSASAKGVCVIVQTNISTGDSVTGVTYGGVALVQTAVCTDTTEAGRTTIWSLPLDTACPTGTQTVTLQGCTADPKAASCSTFTAATTGTKVNASNAVNTTTAANPSVTVVTTATTLLYGGVSGGAAAPTTYVPTANYTGMQGVDFGARSARPQHRTSPVAAGSIVFDFTAGSDDWAIAAVAYEEYTLAEPPPPPPIVVMAPRVPA